MNTVTLARQPQSFTPSGSTSARLSHLDPRPLRHKPAIGGPWACPGFYAACAIVLPAAAVVAPFRMLFRLLWIKS